jgi:hypothetical protein
MFSVLGDNPDGKMGLSCNGLVFICVTLTQFNYYHMYYYIFNFNNNYNYVLVCIFTDYSLYLQARPVSPDTVQQILPEHYCYYGGLDTWTIVRLTTTKYEPFMFSVLGFASAYVSNIHIIMIPANFCYKIVYVRNL